MIPAVVEMVADVQLGFANETVAVETGLPGNDGETFVSAVPPAV